MEKKIDWYSYLVSVKDRIQKSTLENQLMSSHIKNQITLRKEEISCDNIKISFGTMDIHTAVALIEKDRTNPNIVYHEIIYGQQFQKIHFDIECYQSELSLIKCTFQQFLEEFENILLNIMNNISIAEYQTTAGMFFDKTDFFYLSSDGIDKNGKKKYSRHVLFAPDRIHIINYSENLYICEQIQKNINPLFKKFIDQQIYKTVSSMRCIFSQKNNRMFLPLQFRLIRQQKIIEMSLITCQIEKTTEFIIRDCQNKKIRENLDQNQGIEQNSENLVKFCIDHLSKENKDAFSYRGINGNTINFDRLQPSMCNFCREIHHNDNTLFVTISVIGEKEIECYKFYEKCRHSKKGSKMIGTYDINNPQLNSQEKGIKKIQQSIEKAKLELKKFYKNDYENTDYSNYSQMINYFQSKFSLNEINEDDIIEDFPLSKTLFVRSHMGSGKTKKLMNYLKFNFTNDKQKRIARILIISFRQTFTIEIAQKFNKKLNNMGFQFKSYKQSQGIITENQIVCQFESLHRIDSLQQFDLVILDESESIITQVTSGLSKNFNECLSNFEHIIFHCTYLVCLDANLSDRTFQVMKQIGRFQQQQFDEISLQPHLIHHMILNKYRKQHLLLVIYRSKQVLIDQFGVYLEQDIHIVVCTNSIRDSQVLALMVKKHNEECKEQKKLLLYNSKTSKKQKEIDLQNPDVNLIGDILIYTPTITAGISIEKVHYNIIMGIFNAFSCNADTCVQMLGRVRSISTGQMLIYCQYGIQNKPITVADIEQRFCGTFQLLEMETTSQQSLYKVIYQQNLIVHNYSQNNFLSRLIFLIDPLDINIETTIKKISSEFKQFKQECLEIEADLIANAQNLELHQYLEIKRLLEQDEIPDNEEQNMKYAVKKFKIKQTYEINDQLINRNFVMNFGNRNDMFHYRNLQQVLLLWNKDTDESQQEFKKGYKIWFNEQNKYDISEEADQMMNNEEQQRKKKEYKNIQSKMLVEFYESFCKNKRINDFVQLLGWNNIFDKKAISIPDLNNIITQKHDKIKEFVNLFLCKNYKRINTRQTIICGNQLMQKHYGLKFQKKSNEYILDHSKFDFVDGKIILNL